jgi:tetratricopeptide (TPR) repeat protein
MTVVGHIAQLRRSRCYQKSEMTCITCHDLHARKRPEDAVAYYRQKCLDCHGSQGCRLGVEDRLKRDAQDNCVTCHMPRGDTDIPHVSFTHHRIGRHSEASPPHSSLSQAPELVPVNDVSRVPPVDRRRNLALAYLQALRDPTFPEFTEVFRARARQLLEGVYAKGLRDPETTAGLAEVYWGQDLARSAAFARETVEAEGASPEARASTLVILASAQMQEGQFIAARTHLEELVKMRRYADDWRLLGLCYLQLQGPSKALPALEHALAIRPFRVTIQAALADVYRDQGDMRRALEHGAKAQLLHQLRQD